MSTVCADSIPTYNEQHDRKEEQKNVFECILIAAEVDEGRSVEVESPSKTSEETQSIQVKE